MHLAYMPLPSRCKAGRYLWSDRLFGLFGQPLPSRGHFQQTSL
jgi:hypothetical protein